MTDRDESKREKPDAFESAREDPRTGAPRFRPALAASVIAAIILAIAIAQFWPRR